VPSSARSSASAATPLPSQFVPLLGDTVEDLKNVIHRVMPVERKLTALEEAEFEDNGGEDGALERELLSQGLSLFVPTMFLLNQRFSDANPSRLSAEGGRSWPTWNGPGVYWFSCPSPSGGIPCTESGTWNVDGRFDKGMHSFFLFADSNTIA